MFQDYLKKIYNTVFHLKIKYITKNEEYIWKYLEMNNYKFSYDWNVKNISVYPYVWISWFFMKEHKLIFLYWRNKNISTRQIVLNEMDNIITKLKKDNMFQEFNIIKILEDRDLLSTKQIKKDKIKVTKQFEGFPDYNLLNSYLNEQLKIFRNWN